MGDVGEQNVPGWALQVYHPQVNSFLFGHLGNKSKIDVAEDFVSSIPCRIRRNVDADDGTWRLGRPTSTSHF